MISQRFPELFNEFSGLTDNRKGIEYLIAEAVTGALLMFIFKEGSRNAYNNDRRDANFRKNIFRYFKFHLPHSDTYDEIVRNIPPKELENIKSNFRNPIPTIEKPLIFVKQKSINFVHMGQLLLPLFPPGMKMITPTLGVREENGTVHYLHSGVQIYSHKTEAMNKFRFITSNFALQGLCTNQEIVDAFHVSADSVGRWKKKLSEEGESVFFMAEARHGRSHKLLPEVLERIQHKLDEGKSVNSISKKERISEGSVRYAIKQGRLKKNK